MAVNFLSLKYPLNEHIVGVACQFMRPEELDKDTWEGKPVYPKWITVSLPWPFRHGHILHPTHVMAGKHCLIRQGFITSRGRFVDREEAWKIAETQGQIKQVTGGEGTLFSKDLW